MAKFVGRTGTLGLAKEATAGTIVTPTFWLPYTALTFDDKVEMALEEVALGRIEDSDANHVVQKYGEGEIEGELNDRDIGLLLTSLFGATPTSTGGPTYAHAYALTNTNTHRSLSIAYQDPNTTRIYPYSQIDSLNINVSQNAVVAFTAGFKSRVGRDWSTLTPSFTSIGNKFLHQHLSFKIADSTSNLAAATAISLKELDITFSANNDFDFTVGTVEPEAVLNKEFSVEGTLTLNYEDQTYRRYMLDNTYRAMGITFSRAANSSLAFQFPRVSFMEWEQDRGLNDIVSQTINFKGHYDTANAVASVSTATLTNTYAGTNY